MTEREEFSGGDIEPDDAKPSEGDADLDDVQPPPADDDHVVEETEEGSG